jgi:hypothetical protein
VNPDSFRRGATAAALVTQMTVSTVVCGGGGYLADGRWNTTPKLQLAGFVLGFAIGMASFLLTISRLTTNDEPPSDPPV